MKNDPSGEFQSLGRLFRATPKAQVLVIENYDIEHRIAARLAARLASRDLPVLVIHDETVKLKGQAEELLLIPRKGPSITDINKKWGLT